MNKKALKALKSPQTAYVYAKYVIKDRLVAALNRQGANATCEVCGKDNWAVIDQAVSVQVTDLSGSWQNPPPQIPSGGLICNNCGNIRFFALHVLGLLPTAPLEQKK